MDTTKKRKRAIFVEKRVFLRDPTTWFRKASPDQRVVVKNEKGDVAFVIGGMLELTTA
jgi:hypothetical protein